MNIFTKTLIRLNIFIFTLIFSVFGYTDYSIGIGYTPKYSDNFTSFDYVNPIAKKGG